jgi:hypothetical protein
MWFSSVMQFRSVADLVASGASILNRLPQDWKFSLLNLTSVRGGFRMGRGLRTSGANWILPYQWRSRERPVNQPFASGRLYETQI